MPATARLRATLSAYRYSSPTQSLMERVCLVRMWNALAERLPRNIAPNLLTMLGFAAALAAWAIITVHSPDLSGQTPVAWYPLIAFLLFIYQTMDGCDGPQARRLKCGSALGELTDHGVDAVVTTIDILVIVEVLGYSLADSGVLLAILGGHLAFLLSNMSLLHLGRQQFQELDCQEAQITIQLLLVASWLYYDVLGAEARGLPTDIGRTPVPLPGFLATLAGYVPGGAAHQVAVATADSYASFELRWLFVIAGGVGSAGGNTVTILSRILRKYYGGGGGGDASSSASVNDGAKQQQPPPRNANAGGQLDGEEEELVGPGLMLRQVVVGLVWCAAVTVSWSLVRDHAAGAGASLWPLWAAMATFGYGSLALNSLVIRVTKKKLPPLARTPALLIVAGWCALAYAVPRMGIAEESHRQFALRCALALPAAAAAIHQVDYAVRVASEVAEGLGVPFWTVPKPKAPP